MQYFSYTLAKLISQNKISAFQEKTFRVIKWAQTLIYGALLII